jgi:hypothetical protein
MATLSLKGLLNYEAGGIVNFTYINKSLLAVVLAPNVGTLPAFHD